jgi:hypothetical protein
MRYRHRFVFGVPTQLIPCSPLTKKPFLSSPSTSLRPSVLSGLITNALVIPPCVSASKRLAAHEQPETLLATQAETARPTIKLADASDEAGGQTLGRYKLLERVGEGGCGVFYVAEQTEPVRRRVALKVIKLGHQAGHRPVRGGAAGVE